MSPLKVSLLNPAGSTWHLSHGIQSRAGWPEVPQKGCRASFSFQCPTSQPLLLPLSKTCPCGKMNEDKGSFAHSFIHSFVQLINRQLPSFPGFSLSTEEPRGLIKGAYSQTICILLGPRDKNKTTKMWKCWNRIRYKVLQGFRGECIPQYVSQRMRGTFLTEEIPKGFKYVTV